MAEFQSKSRRRFLKDFVLLLLANSASLPSFAQSQPPYALPEWTGDNFSLGHKMRNGEIPPLPKNTERTVDFVIVGGGMAGLAAAYYLRNHNFLLLEQYGELGGQSRGATHRGVAYSFGAAYLDEPDDLAADLLNDLNLSPVKLGPTKNAWFDGKSWLTGIEGEGSFYKDIKRFRQDAKSVLEIVERQKRMVPLDDTELSKLDAVSFGGCLTGYGPLFMSLMNSFSRSSNCAGLNGISALAGYMTLQDLTANSYVLPGGNPAAARALAAKIAGGQESERAVLNAFVWSVQIKDGGASVVYSSPEGQMHRVDCKHVIVSTPPMVAARILHGIDDSLKAQLLSFKYGSYLVANLLLTRPVFKGAYDNWFTPPFTFGDVVVAETPYEMKNSYDANMGSVLTVYQPYEPSSPGRPLLQVGDREQFAASIVKQLASVTHNDLQKNLEAVALSRWGHAMAVASPGFFGKMSKIAATTPGSLSLAHCSTQGLACFESALRAARKATHRALCVKQKS